MYLFIYVMDTLKTDFKNKLIEISKLSDKINKHDKNKLLDLIKEHIKEIEELYKKSLYIYTFLGKEKYLARYSLKDINYNSYQ